MKSLLKTEMKNLPLSIPAAWVDFFDDHAALLGISRNAAFRLAMKFGGPVLARLCEVAADRLRESVENMEWTSEIVVSPAFPASRGKSKAHDRRQSDTGSGSRSPEKPGSGQKVHGKARGESLPCHTGKPRKPGQGKGQPARPGSRGRRT